MFCQDFKIYSYCQIIKGGPKISYKNSFFLGLQTAICMNSLTCFKINSSLYEISFHFITNISSCKLIYTAIAQM